MTNYYIRFDLELDKFGVNVQVLQNPVVLQEVVGWTEDWEKDQEKELSYF